MKPRLHIRQALSDPHLLGRSLEGDSWRPWRVLIAAMGEKREPCQRVNELAVVAGRRGGKIRSMATLAAYIAGVHSDVLVPRTRDETPPRVDEYITHVEGETL
jgi:hypothetical protein